MGLEGLLVEAEARSIEARRHCQLEAFNGSNATVLAPCEAEKHLSTIRNVVPTVIVAWDAEEEVAEGASFPAADDNGSLFSLLRHCGMAKYNTKKHFRNCYLAAWNSVVELLLASSHDGSPPTCPPGTIFAHIMLMIIENAEAVLNTVDVVESILADLWVIHCRFPRLDLGRFASVVEDRRAYITTVAGLLDEDDEDEECDDFYARSTATSSMTSYSHGGQVEFLLGLLDQEEDDDPVVEPINIYDYEYELDVAVETIFSGLDSTKRKREEDGYLDVQRPTKWRRVDAPCPPPTTTIIFVDTTARLEEVQVEVEVGLEVGLEAEAEVEEEAELELQVEVEEEKEVQAEVEVEVKVKEEVEAKVEVQLEEEKGLKATVYNFFKNGVSAAKQFFKSVWNALPRFHLFI